MTRTLSKLHGESDRSYFNHRLIKLTTFCLRAKKYFKSLKCNEKKKFKMRTKVNNRQLSNSISIQCIKFFHLKSK